MTHDDANPQNSKIEINGQGLGTVTVEMVEQRARELAKIDGRAEVNEGDLILARAELQEQTHPGTAPEVDERTESLVTWDQVPEESGGRVPARPLEDEGSMAQQLVEEGIEEADHNQRLSAANEEI